MPRTLCIKPMSSCTPAELDEIDRKLSCNFTPSPFQILVHDRPWRHRGRCPRCHGTLFRRRGWVYCDTCSEVSPQLAAMIRCRPSLTNVEREQQVSAEEQITRNLERDHPLILDEATRRAIYFGRTNVFDRDTRDLVTDLAAVGRKWLKEIDQLPDWSIVLDRQGREIGRLEESA